MNQDLKAKKGVIEMVIHVTRKETGLTETFNIVGEILPETEEVNHGSDSSSSDPQRGS